MEQVFQFFQAYEIWIYVTLGILILWQIRKFVLAWEELRGAFFGLEREAAQAGQFCCNDGGNSNHDGGC